MEPPATTSSDSHIVQSSAAVQKAYFAAGQKNVSSLPPAVPSTPTLSSIPVQPSDESAIEQQWIEKAKQVVAHAQDDPFMQNKLLSELKAEYLAMRYGRSAGTKQEK